MFRIGILGSDNSHAIVFSRLFNLGVGEVSFPTEEYKVVGIYGRDPGRTREVAEKGAISFIAERPEDLMDKVDAIMVVFRHGDLHAVHALPYIEAGIPTWVDKPFAIKVEDAKAMIEAAQAHDTPLTGGSTVKHALDELAMRERLNATGRGSIRPLISAMVNGYASLENEYGGIYFYGSHLAELTMFLFGYDARSVLASGCGGNVLAIVKYDDYQVIMNFMENAAAGTHVIAFGEKGTILQEMDHTTAYRRGMENFVQMLETGESPFPLDHLLMPVVLLQAVARSIEQNREIQLRELM